ncbi:hypothetical protein H2248_011491 [Termitomyces sp. 'cryptogamus']|nr:hypothetical protein H2248_011491 [Termitomyces sp. 'cryptogamus']
MASSGVYGHDMLALFGLDPDFLHLNHGSFGALPNVVREAYNAISQEVERNPDLFIRRCLGQRMREVRRRLAAHLKAHEDECVLIPNVTHGINLILRSLPWSSGQDVLIYTSTAFSQIKRNVFVAGGLPTSPILSEFSLDFPQTHMSILSQFSRHIRAVKGKAASKTIRIAALFDSIVSTPGVTMPWKGMVEICHAEGITSIVDAAHSLGQEPINLSETQPDFWIGNCSKWLYAKRGSAVLYVAQRNQYLIPNNIPAGLGWFEPVADTQTMSLFAGQFYWNGSTDVALPLTLVAALDFRLKIGGEKRIIDYCHTLAIEGGKCVAEILGTEVMDMPEAPGELVGTMVNVLLPLPETIRPSPDVLRAFDQKLFSDRRAYAVIYYHNNCWWVRISAQVYNQLSDFEEFGQLMLIICEEMKREFTD